MVGVGGWEAAVEGAPVTAADDVTHGNVITVTPHLHQLDHRLVDPKGAERPAEHADQDPVEGQAERGPGGPASRRRTVDCEDLRPYRTSRHHRTRQRRALEGHRAGSRESRY